MDLISPDSLYSPGKNWNIEEVKLQKNLFNKIDLKKRNIGTDIFYSFGKNRKMKM